jgi:hypothetical protein
MTKPCDAKAMVATLGVNASAKKPKYKNPIGPVPMHADRTPNNRARISMGEFRKTKVACMTENPKAPKETLQNPQRREPVASPV